MIWWTAIRNAGLCPKAAASRGCPEETLTAAKGGLGARWCASDGLAACAVLHMHGLQKSNFIPGPRSVTTRSLATWWARWRRVAKGKDVICLRRDADVADTLLIPGCSATTRSSAT